MGFITGFVCGVVFAVAIYVVSEVADFVRSQMR